MIPTTTRKPISPALAAIGIAGATVFLVLALQDWSDPTPRPWDLQLTVALQSIQGLGPLMYAISWPGWPPQSLVFACALTLGLAAVGFRTALLAVPAAITTELLVTAVKITVARPRPDVSLVTVLSVASGNSFPSGHTTQYTLMLGYITYLSWQYMHGWKRWTTTTICVVFIVLVGPSRVYLGQHWPSDVIAGYGLGTAMLSVLIAAEAWFQTRVPATDSQVANPSSVGPISDRSD